MGHSAAYFHGEIMKHAITLYETGIVIVGQNHNPSILNPDFLWRHKIVAAETKLADKSPPFNTPMASQSTFENGLHIVSEPNRISFVETDIKNGGLLCCDTAKKYLRVVPLVHYTAVGINFFGFFSTRDDTFAPHDLLTDHNRLQYEDVCPSAEITLTYPLADKTVNLTIRNSKLSSPGAEQKVVVRGNFHHRIHADEGESYKVARATIDEREKDLECFNVLVEKIANSIGE